MEVLIALIHPTINLLIEELGKIGTPKFVRILNFSNDESELTEIANYTINLGTSYANAKESDTNFLLNLENMKQFDFGALQPVAQPAWEELLNSSQNANPDSEARSQAQIEAYWHIHGINNFKIHKETGRLYVYGMKIAKEVVREGVYKADTRRAKTIAKDMIRRKLKSAQFRMFPIDKLTSVKFNGETLDILI